MDNIAEREIEDVMLKAQKYARRAMNDARMEEAARWAEATRHTVDCVLATSANKPLCSCGAHAALADLQAEYASKLRRKSFR